MTTRRTALGVVSTAALAALALTACSSGGGSESASGPDGIDLVKAGTLTVCSNPPYEPFEYEEDGKIVGFDIALTEQVAKDLGVTTTVLTTGFEGIQSGAALEARTCDIVASGITITDERKKNIDFSEPYFDADQGVLVPEGSPIASEADLEGLRIGVQQATTGSAWVEDEGLTGVQFEDLGLQVQALKSKTIDAVINDVAVLGPWANDGFEVAFTIPTGEQYGLGVKKGNTALLEQVNATLERIRTDGTYDELWDTYIGVAR